MRSLKYLLSFSIIFNIFLFSYEDLGVVGNQYEIAEENLDDVKNEGIKNLDVQKIKQSYIDSFNSKFTSKTTLPDSKSDLKYTKENYVILDYDIVSPMDNSVIKKAGEKIYPNLPKGQSRSICLIKGNYSIQIIDKILKEFGTCIYLIANKDIRKFESHPFLKTQQVFPYDKVYEDRFKLKTLPAKVTIHDIYFDYQLLNMDRIKEEVINENSTL